MITVRRAVKWLVLAAVVAIPSPAHAAGVDLSTYERIGRYDLPEPKRTVAPANSLLAQEASAVTYDWDTDSLFVVGDGGTSVVQVSKTGQLIDSMTLAQGTSPQGTAFYDTEGIAYVGGGKFVLSEERDRQVNLFTYVPNTTLDRAGVQTVKLGTTVGNIGIEGLSYDPQTSGFVVVKESGPEGIFQTGIDFVAHTATNGSPTTVNSTDLFDPALAGLADFSDVFALSNVPAFAGPDASHLLILSQEAGKIVNVDRAGKVSSTLTIVGDADNPQPVPEQSHEGLAMDASGKLYVVSETGGGDIDHPQLWVYAPSATPAPPNLIVSEVSPWSSGNSPYAADWFEVTNKGTQAVDLTGWKVDDSSNAYATAVALNGISSIAPGQSVIFIEGTSATAEAFKTAWFGANVPAGFAIGTYSGAGIGLSTAGDAVNLFDAAGKRITGVTFGASTDFFTFDNAAGLAAVSTLSVAGVNGAFVAGQATGSPGAVSGARQQVQATGTVNATVPAQLSLVLGGAASFAPFTAGLTKDYLAATTATVTSTGADAALSVADASTVAPGHMVNGSYVLPQALQVNANAGSYSPVSAIPATLLAWAGPVSGAQVTIGLKQPIAVTDPLRTGSYAKTLTFSLSTTAP